MKEKKCKNININVENKVVPRCTILTVLLYSLRRPQWDLHPTIYESLSDLYRLVMQDAMACLRANPMQNEKVNE